MRNLRSATAARPRQQRRPRGCSAKVGYGPGKTLRLEMVPAPRHYVEQGVLRGDQLRWWASRPTSSSRHLPWFPGAMARRAFQIAAPLTAGGFDDPDAYLSEVQVRIDRNYTGLLQSDVDRQMSSSRGTKKKNRPDQR